MLGEALTADIEVREVFAEPAADRSVVERAEAAGAVLHEVPDGLLAKVTGTVTPQSVAAVAARFDLTLEAATEPLAAADDPLVLLLAGVNDPGNLGTILRSASAVGVAVVLCCDDTVDIYNPKVVRASAGTMFSLGIVREAGGRQAVDVLRRHGVSCVGTVVQGGLPYDRADLTGRIAVVLGNEAHGLPQDLAERLDELVSIPMVGPAESLNVAMAGTVVCFEALRQRRTVSGDQTNLWK